MRKVGGGSFLRVTEVEALQARVLFDFRPRSKEELELSEGEIISVLLQVNTDWWQGENATGQTGLFPSSFVVPIGELLFDYRRTRG